nr:hypothetical protein [Tanacetum cinerariifolium]
MDGLEGVLKHGTWLICNVSFILRKWTSRSMLTKEALNSILIWIKFHGVLVLAFTPDSLSDIASRLGKTIMLDLCTTTTCMQSWGRMDYARALIEIRADRDLKDTMRGTSNDCFHTVQKKDFHGPFGSKQGTRGTSNDCFHTVQKKDFHGPFGSKQGTKKIEAPPKKTLRKTRVWLGRKADSPKRNIVFSLETKVHYLDREDVEFDDIGQEVEEVEHENVYSKNG